MSQRTGFHRAMHRWLVLILFAALVCFAVSANSACRQETEQAVTLTADPAETIAETVMPATEAAVANELGDGPISVDDIGQLGSVTSFASIWVQPVEMLVRDSDIVVRAVFVSESSDLLRFRSIEYLKGTGPAEFEVRASTEGRNRKWDDREGVLLLTYGRSTEARRGEDERMDEALYFTNSRPAATGYSGSLPDTYMYYGRKPAWLPAIGEGLIRAEGDTTVSYTTGTWPYGGVPPAGQDYTRSVTELRSLMAQSERRTTPTFADCEDRRGVYQDYYIYVETAIGSPWAIYVDRREVMSGVAEGAIVLAVERWAADETTDQYHKYWLTGRDANLFDARFIDPDMLPDTGFVHNVVNSRPLPRGTYEFIEHVQDSWYFPCNFVPPNDKSAWIVTATAPTGTLHEAFFDPVALSGGGVGVTGSSGVIDPDEFTVGSDDVEIDGLEWRSGSVVLELDDYVSLSGQALDFIELDGSIDTSLDIADATVNQTAATWTWSVASQPWDDGDLLMLRVRDSSVTPPPPPPPATPTPTPTATPIPPTATPTPTATPIPPTPMPPTPIPPPTAAPTAVPTPEPALPWPVEPRVVVLLTAPRTVTVDWPDVADADSYEVSFFVNSDDDYVLLSTSAPVNGITMTITGTSAEVSNLPTDQGWYFFKVRARNAVAVSEWSWPQYVASS